MISTFLCFLIHYISIHNRKSEAAFDAVLAENAKKTADVKIVKGPSVTKSDKPEKKRKLTETAPNSNKGNDIFEAFDEEAGIK